MYNHVYATLMDVVKTTAVTSDLYPLFRKEFNIQVLQEFVRMHKFHSLDLVAALRAFLGSFQLPGEAQKIDRMMESFAQRYCDCNPGMFSNTGQLL